MAHAYLIGSAAQAFATELDGIVETSLSGDLETATTSAFADANAAAGTDGRDATILLSPAAASFDQFANFVARGDAFISIAFRLTADAATTAVQEGAHA